MKSSLTKNLTIRISERDDQALFHYATRLGETNRTRIVRKMICELGDSGPYLLGDDLDAFREAVREVRAAGVNLNQLMRAINSGKIRVLSAQDFEIVKAVSTAIDLLRQALNAIILRSRNQPVKDVC